MCNTVLVFRIKEQRCINAPTTQETVMLAELVSINYLWIKKDIQ